MGTCVSKCCSVTAEPLPPPPPPPSAETKCRTGATSRTKLDVDKLVVPRSRPHSYSSQSTTSSSFSNTSTSTSTSTSASTCSSCSSSKTRLYSDDFLPSFRRENPSIIIVDPHKFFEGPLSKKKPRSSPVRRTLKPRHPNRPAPAPRSTREGSGLPVSTPPASPALRSSNSSSTVKVQDCSLQKTGGATLVDNIDNPLISMECFIFI